MEGGRGGEARGETSPLKSVFDSSQLSGSINVQDGGTTLFLKTIHGSRSKIRLLCKLFRARFLVSVGPSAEDMSTCGPRSSSSHARKKRPLVHRVPTYYFVFESGNIFPVCQKQLRPRMSFWNRFRLSTHVRFCLKSNTFF